MRNTTFLPIPQLLVGPHNPMFFQYADMIGKKIKEMNLKSLPATQLKEKTENAYEYAFEPYFWKFGGIKVAHLHFQNEVYLLTNEQWKIFSKSLLEGFKNQLSKASSVSFENAQAIAGELENVI